MPSRNFKRIISKFIAMCLMLLVPAYGFPSKLNTHIWVGQQVINDLEKNGTITVRLRGQNVVLPVREDIRQAILQNKNEYLLGSIGPDAMPDVVVGQSILHPGQSNGWKANDFAQHLLQNSSSNAAGKAFTYGYLSHMAADVFAHTYVNQYAGDHFDLSNETLVEERHIALESYIGKYTPQLRNSTGTYLGTPSTVVHTSDALANFLRDQLIYSPQVQQQYKNSQYASHLVVFKEYRAAIATVTNDPIWRQIDIAVAKFISAEFGYNLSTPQAARVVDALDKISKKVNNGINVTQDEFTALNRDINSLDLRLAAGVRSAADRLTTIEAGLLDAQNKFDKLVLEKTCDRVDEVCRVPVPTVKCNWLGICLPDVKYVTDPVCAASFKTTCKTAQVLLELRTTAQNQLLQNRKKVNAEIAETYAGLVKARESSIALQNALIDFLQIPANGSSPIKSILENWGADSDVAISEYVKAATQAMINTMDPAASSTAPIQRWLDCYYPSLVGVPAVVSNCKVRDSATQIVRSLDRLANLPTNVVASSIGLPTTTQIANLRTKVEQIVLAKVKEKLTGKLIELLPQKVQGILNVLHEDINATRLQFYFTKAETQANLGLIKIPDIATRVDREMALSGGFFSPTKFATAYNSVVLAKLALLDNAGLVQLAQTAGVPTNLFSGTENIVAGAFASIDGNHQWLTIAPLRPSIGGAAPRRLQLDGYPYSTGYRTAAGFVLWQPAARDTLFRGLFIGPMSAGVEAPVEIGMPNILPDGYPYHACKINPFPNDENDLTCVGNLVPWEPPVDQCSIRTAKIPPNCL